MKLAFVGPSRCGKDEAAEWFAKHTPLRYWGSCSKVICPHVAKRLGVSEESAYADRHQHRDLWRKIGDELRLDDPGYLARIVTREGDIVAGVRSIVEMLTVRSSKMVDLVIWVDRPEVTDDPTLEFGPELADVILPNWSDLEAYHRRLAALANALGLSVAA